jgi:CRISPR-associated protein Cas2
MTDESVNASSALGYKAVWLFAMFDLPVATKSQRKLASQFRKHLLMRGFCMLQFSVYARHCPSEEAAEVIRTQVASILPDEGQVRLVSITDRQFGKMRCYVGKSCTAPEPPPPQLMLF